MSNNLLLLGDSPSQAALGTWNLKAEMPSGLALATRHGHTTMTLYASETLGALLALCADPFRVSPQGPGLAT